jgi:hypothetical protein
MTNQGSGNAYTTSGTHLCLELAAQAQLNFAAGRKSVGADGAQIDGEGCSYKSQQYPPVCGVRLTTLPLPAGQALASPRPVGSHSFRSIRPTAARFQTVPADDLLDQFLAEPPRQWV